MTAFHGVFSARSQTFLKQAAVVGDVRSDEIMPASASPTQRTVSSCTAAEPSQLHSDPWMRAHSLPISSWP